MTQIFKTQIPTDSLFTILELNCIKNGFYYIFDINSYKKGIFNESISTFLANCKEYYYLSKHKYLDRKLTYNSFATVLRQICNYNKISYKTEIKYDKSTYNIVYLIYFLNANSDTNVVS